MNFRRLQHVKTTKLHQTMFLKLLQEMKNLKASKTLMRPHNHQSEDTKLKFQRLSLINTPIRSHSIKNERKTAKRVKICTCVTSS